MTNGCLNNRQAGSRTGHQQGRGQVAGSTQQAAGSKAGQAGRKVHSSCRIENPPNPWGISDPISRSPERHRRSGIGIGTDGKKEVV